MEAPQQKFRNPEEELQFLREQVAQQEIALRGQHVDKPHEDAVEQVVQSYHAAPIETVLTESMQKNNNVIEKLALDLFPEDHDVTMNELYEMVLKEGVKNTLSVISKMHNPHIEDDFHRFLVALIHSGQSVTGIKEKGPLYRALHMILYEVILPPKKDEERQVLKELVSSMEQFYAGMLSVVDKENIGQQYFALELALPNVGEEFSFFVSVPVDKKELFEKQIISVFPEAQIFERKNDYNIFNETGVSLASVATLKERSVLPLKTYDQFDHDPLSAIINSFSKIDNEGEGAALQIIFNPAGGDEALKKFKYSLGQLEKGVPSKEALSVGLGVLQDFKKGIGGFFKNPEKPGEEPKEKKIDQALIENVQKKIGSPIVNVNVRLVASSRTEVEADAILDDIEASFNQFTHTQGNKIVFKRLSGSARNALLKDFAFRTYAPSQALLLNISEITSMFHFQNQGIRAGEQMKHSKAGSAPVPAGMPVEGLLIGVNRHRGKETMIRMTPEDRLRHMYVIGQTGTGKSTMLKNMVIQDMKNGEGVCYIDPHGADVQDILAAVPPERYKDVIYFDPSHTERPMGLNMLEYNPAYPEQKTFVVNELFGIFQKLYSGVPESMGPMFEQYFRNATMLVIEDPDTGSTLLDVSRVLSDKEYRELKLSRCPNPVVVQFWREVAGKAGGEASLSNVVPYITNKFDVFLANDIMRPIVAQQKSAINFREVMDNRKILLVNLAKGRLGDINSNLIGLILVGKFLMSALSRVDSFGKEIPPFYLYIDEFQNVTTNSISSILSEARKYKLSLTVAHQFIAQLEEDISDAVFGNVGSMVSFRVGSEDAEFLAKQFAPTFTATDLMNVDNFNGFIKMLVNGRPVTPFNIETLRPDPTDTGKLDQLKQLSYLEYGRARAEVEAEILSKYRTQ